MLIDFLEQSEKNKYEADICIVGSGVVGLAIAEEFYNTFTSVIVLESGDIDILEEVNQNLYDCNIVAHPFLGHLLGRFRIYGGSSTRWGGQALPFDEIDFEKRDWIEYSGWPISKMNLLSYYERADRYLKVDKAAYETDLIENFNLDDKFADTDLSLCFSKWTPTPNLGKVHRDNIKNSKNITLLYHANLTDFVLSEEGNSINYAIIKNLEKKIAEVSAKKYILCCGGIENAKILLSANNLKGVGNSSGFVGKFFFDHPSTPIGGFSSNCNHQLLRKYFGFNNINKVTIMPRISLNKQWQVEHQSVNANAFVRFEANPLFWRKPLNRLMVRGYESLTTLQKTPNLETLKQIFYSLKNYINYLKTIYLNSSLFPDVFVMLEQIPSFESNITLSEDRDILGLPKINLRWEIGKRELDTLFSFAQILKTFFREKDFGELILKTWIAESDYSCKDNLEDFYHHMGTTRMSDSEVNGVVDTNLKVWGNDNLYVCGSSVFPTGGHSNPTLTAIALAKRLSDNIKKELLK